MMIEKTLNSNNPDIHLPDIHLPDYPGEDRLEALRICIIDENYLHAAIQRLALVISNELMDFTKEGDHGLQKRK